MTQRVIRNEEELQKAAADLANLREFIPFVITITEGAGIRTSKANASYWVDITHFMIEINNAVERLAEETGMTNIQARRTVAEEMEVEHALILYARQAEVVHEIMKAICNIPTSTRLGTKKFAKFHDLLTQTMAEILGQVQGLTRV